MSLKQSLIRSLFSLEHMSFQHSDLLSLVAETISLFNSMVLDSQLEPVSKLYAIVSQKSSLPTSNDSEYESKLFSLMTQLISPDNTDSKFMSLLSQIIFQLGSVDQMPKSELTSLVAQAIPVFRSRNLASYPEPLSKLISLIAKRLMLSNSVYSKSESELFSLITRLMSTDNTESELIQFISLLSSVDLEWQPKRESEFMSFIKQGVSLFNSMDLESEPEPMSKLISLISQLVSSPDAIISGSELESLIDETWSLEPKPDIMSLIHQIRPLFFSTEWKLRSLISQISSLLSSMYQLSESGLMSEVASNVTSLIGVIKQLIPLATSMNLDSQPKPHSKFMSLLTQTISVANSISDSDLEWKLISLVTELIPLILSTCPEEVPPLQLFKVMGGIFSHFYRMDADLELISLITQLLYFTDSVPEAEWDPSQFISLSPKLKLQLVRGKFHVMRKVERKKEKCQPGSQQKVYLSRGEDATHFRCKDCNGEDHETSEKTPVEVKHLLHPKHLLQLVLQKSSVIQTRNCFCCDEDLQKYFYYCPACDFAMNIACVNKPPVLSVDYPKWHEHTLALFPRHAFLNCNLCALTDTSSPIYMCPNCDFVVHQSCLSFPRVIRISRHSHRLSFTPSFNQGDWSCGVCRKIIDNDYGSYSCINDGCSYAAHFRCATQRNVWDGIDLEGVPEDIEEEELEPFVQISDGVIQHFSHQHHHLRLDENTGRDYNHNKYCQACIIPIYFGNIYSCLQCDFILHEECANFSRKIYHPIHPHPLSLVDRYDGVKNRVRCSACPWPYVSGFFYECRIEGCDFWLHINCATISEPLVHAIHTHPLFLTSKPEERRTCGACNNDWPETFNCIECNFSLCYNCATIPQKVRYKHDKHTLFLSYGEKTSTMKYWCEACEREIDPRKGFYKCDEYCCVALHIRCLIGPDVYMKPGSYFYRSGLKLLIVPNNHMSRPICIKCKKRCPYNTYLSSHGIVAHCRAFCI